MSVFQQLEVLKSPTGASLALRAAAVKGKAKGVVHINHGMSEHSLRYARFAERLVAAGYHVCAHDHRGHGETRAPDAPVGTFAGSGGWNLVIADVDAVNVALRERYTDTPVIMFGHSMGAIIGLNYCIHHSDRLDAAALWNSGVDGGLLLAVYGFLLSMERMFRGSDTPSQIANKLTFETWNRKFAPNRTESDWLSRDEAEVDKYIADPLCGFDVSNGLWRDVLKGIKAGASNHELARIRGDLPMHLLAGGQDPCSDCGKAVTRLSERLSKAGITDLECRIYPDNRHEALNELNHDEVMDGFVGWLDQRFG